LRMTSNSPLHAAWLKKTFTSTNNESSNTQKQENHTTPSGGVVWPDLLLSRAIPQPRNVTTGNMSSTNPMIIERNNLMAVADLVIKQLLDLSLRLGRKIESEEYPPLLNLISILELILKHGFIQGRKFSLGQKDIWSLLQYLDANKSATGGAATSSLRSLISAAGGGGGSSSTSSNTSSMVSDGDGICASVDCLSLKTSSGKLRAWLRLGLMQKSLPDKFKMLIDCKSQLCDYYHPESLVCSEDAVLLYGRLIALNVVDFNLCLKDQDFDNHACSIDLTQYLRKKEDSTPTHPKEEEGGKDETMEQLREAMDQKNYVEELNRTIKINMNNIQARYDKVVEENKGLRQDREVRNNKLDLINKENSSLSQQLEEALVQLRAQQMHQMELNVSNTEPSTGAKLEVELKAELEKRKQTETELELEEQKLIEMEMAMKLLEQDVQGKQDTIVSLRSQLEDIKSLNLEMNMKFSETKRTLNMKEEMISLLESKSVSLVETAQQLDDKFLETQKELGAAKARLHVAEAELTTEKESRLEAEQDVKIEREWRERLQESCSNEKEVKEHLTQEIVFLKQVSNDYENMRQENLRLKEMNKEQDQTLEELGQQLSWYKITLDSMKDETTTGRVWEKDKEVISCKICSKEFNIARRKHHCRNCGGIFCDKCSDNKMELPSSANKVRVCDNCYHFLLERNSKI